MSPPHSPQQPSRPHLCTHTSTSRSATRDQTRHLLHSPHTYPTQPDLTFALTDSFFEDAFSPGSPPTPPSFLDNILNPEPNNPRTRRGPSWYNSTNSYRERPQSPTLTTYTPFRITTMSSRPPSGFVDLTSDPPSPPRQTRRTGKRSHRTSAEPAAGPSSKRIKRNDGVSVDRGTGTATPQVEIEEIDLSDDKVTLQEALRKQRAEAVKAQEKPDEKPLRLSNLQCVICLEQPTDMTATSCGHLYCHTCLMESLIAGENLSAQGGETKKSTCPICRKFISRGKASDIIPLLMKKGLATQPRKKSTPAVI